jgi:SLIT-ROBO Rho GTPase activating protein
MMDAYNLAICFGPTLLPIPPDRDQVSYQSNVHEVVKTVIVHQEDLFSGDDSGMMYEKCILEDRYAYIFMKEGISEYFDFNS